MRENGRSAHAVRVGYVGYTWLLVLILCEGPAHMLHMHNAKQTSSVQVAGMGWEGTPLHLMSTASSHEG